MGRDLRWNKENITTRAWGLWFPSGGYNKKILPEARNFNYIRKFNLRKVEKFKNKLRKSEKNGENPK